MARYFDSILGERDDGALNTFNHDGFIENSLDNLPVYTPSESMPAEYLSKAGFVPNPDPNNQGTYVAPSRALTEHYARKEGIRQQNLQRQMESTRDSTMFKVGDTLADTGRLFLSPLFWLSGEDTTKYDPSARIEAGYKQQMAASEDYRRGMYEKLLTARDARQQQSIALRQKAYENSLPQSSEAKAIRDFAISTNQTDLYNSGSLEDHLNLSNQMQINDGTAYRVGVKNRVMKGPIYDKLTAIGSKYETAYSKVSEAFSGYESLMESLSGEGSGISDIAAVFSFMKSLDPRSVVREGEFQMAASASGVFDQLMNTGEKLKDGKILPEDAVKAMRELAPRLIKHWVESADSLRSNYEGKVRYLSPEQEDIDVFLGKRSELDYFNRGAMSETGIPEAVIVPDGDSEFMDTFNRYGDPD